MMFPWWMCLALYTCVRVIGVCSTNNKTAVEMTKHTAKMPSFCYECARSTAPL